MAEFRYDTAAQRRRKAELTAALEANRRFVASFGPFEWVIVGLGSAMAGVLLTVFVHSTVAALFVASGVVGCVVAKREH